jgi:predicted ATPase
MYRIFVEDVPRRDREIELKYLSSGEKQVISLFAQIYLSKAKRFFVIIDEPELSLSVPWQRKLLPDLWSSGNCEFLAAVTHSPFIFDNELEGYTHDLSDGVRIDG